VRFLCLSDIHGHADALSAVLATAERRGYGRVLVAGDICFPGPQPLAVWRRLSQIPALCVQGVGDRALATVEIDRLRPHNDYEQSRLRRLLEVRDELGERILDQLAKRPQLARVPIASGGHLALVHGSPRDPLEPMTHDMSDEMLVHFVGDEPARVIVCGGSHVPFHRTIVRQLEGAAPEKVLIVNVGSVGEAPGPDDDGTAGHGRCAHGTFIVCREGGIEVEQFVVPLGRAAYDVGAARQ
jgi:predicted phosphodiesterase